MEVIDKTTRITNYIIDFTIINFVWLLLAYSTNMEYFFSTIVFYVIMFLYYFIFEITKGQTLGKMVTKTKVVDKNGNTPRLPKLVIRTIARLIPIDGLSYLFGTEYGFHDSVSSTKLIKIK
ncbi:MAG: RDD family protein [Flavobacteriaceae bacterium]